MTRTRTLLAALLAATSLATTAALAQDVPKSTGKPDREIQRRAAFDRIDSNKDGFIDRSESRAAREALFDRRDRNKDGQLGPDEVSRRRARAPRRQEGSVNAQSNPNTPTPSATSGRPTRAQRTFLRLDTDKSGAVSRAEWIAADSAYFDRCDMNKDGKLAFDECRRRTASRSHQPAAIR